METINDKDYTSIIPTAYLTAYPRTLTDIPYAQEIFNQIGHIRSESGLPELGEELKKPRLAPELEARYKLIDRLLAKSGIKQIIELAAGLSGRGIAMSNDPAVSYSELDLPEMAELKKNVLEKFVAIPENLRIVGGNALRLSDIDEAMLGFSSQRPVAVVNEGLMRYLNFPEKMQLAANVRSILEKFGGVWITSDATPKKFYENQDSVTAPDFNKDLMELSGKNFDDNMFDDLNHARSFFEKLGFTIEVHHFSDVEYDLSSTGKLNLPAGETLSLIRHGIVVVMRIKSWKPNRA